MQHRSRLEPETLCFANGRGPDAQDDLGPVGGGEVGVPQKKVGVGNEGRTLPVPPATEARGRIGENRPARPHAEARDGGGRGAVVISGPTEEDAALVCANDRANAGKIVRREPRSADGDAGIRRRARTSHHGQLIPLSDRLILFASAWVEGFAQGPIQMHHTGGGPDGLRH